MTTLSDKIKAAEAQWRDEQTAKAREKRIAEAVRRAEERAEVKRILAERNAAQPRTPATYTNRELATYGLSSLASVIGKVCLYALLLALGLASAIVCGIFGIKQK